MPAHQQIGQCVQQCVQAAHQLRSTINQLPDSRSREMATFAALHLEMCVRQCEDAAQLVQAFGRL